MRSYLPVFLGSSRNFQPHLVRLSTYAAFIPGVGKTFFNFVQEGIRSTHRPPVTKDIPIDGVSYEWTCDV